MDPLAALLAADGTENDEEKKEHKKERKNKLSPAAMKKLQARLAEELRQQQIKQRQEYLKETKVRVQAEWEQNHAKALLYEGEFAVRHEGLKRSFERLSEVVAAWKEYVREKRKISEWAQYLDCGRLPDPASVSQMNSYIFVWTELDVHEQMAFCMRKTEEVMRLLTGLEDVINDPGPDPPPNFLSDMKELRSEIQRLLLQDIDRATFYLFSRVESAMEPVNVTTSKYFAQCPQFRMNLWAELITPIPSTTGKETRHPLKLTFDGTDIVVVIPVILLDVHKVIRVMWCSFDHWSVKCRTYSCPELPGYYHKNLLELLLSEFEIKAEIMNYREKLEMTTKKKISAIPPEPTLSQEIFAWDGEPQRALSEEIIHRECEEEDNMGRSVKAALNEFEVNLRERTILGDLLFFDIFHRPPQPKYLRFKHNVTLRDEPPELRPVDYYVKYPPPEPEEEADEEEDSEEESGETRPRYTAPTIDLTEEIKKLVVIQFKPCQSVVWFEQPQLANWDPVHGYWSSENIHDVNYQEEDGTITFKTGRLGLIGLHVSRYANMPYLDWILEPGENSGINFHLKTSKAEFYFNIREGEVCLESMRNVPSKTMNWILGKYYPTSKLAEHLKKGGIDVFPAPDAASYLEEINSKHVVVESHIYQVWGLFSSVFRFKFSKFNQVARRSDIVFQAQEIYKNHQVDYCLIQTSMFHSYVLDINEESERYSPEPAPYMTSHVDLYGLLYNNATMRARRESAVTSFLLIETLREFLNLIRPLSFG